MTRARSGQPGARPAPLTGGTLYTQNLLFPERAEHLKHAKFSAYRVQLDHWRELSTVFQRAFQAVYERQSASVLLVHGDQGTGKTLFTRKLYEDFSESRQGRISGPDRENLWHVLTGGEPLDMRLIEEATKTSDVKLLMPTPNWLTEATAHARSDSHRMRVFVIDDFHKDGFLCEWASLSRGEYLQLKTASRLAVLESVAQRIVEDCRGALAPALLVLLSADLQMIQDLKSQLDRSHLGLAQILHLPLPKPEMKEQIVRTNINRLNQRSYWYCLDQGGPEDKIQAYETLKGDGGFIDSFHAIDRALISGDGDHRAGRPANKNLITLVTLGTSPAEVAAFHADREMVATAEFKGTHVHTWLFRRSWASALESDDQEYVRVAALVESEFALRWISLDPRATWALCDDACPPAAVEPILALIRQTPSIADRGATQKTTESADQALAALTDTQNIEDFMRSFRDAGQGRSRSYERSLARHFGAYSQGLSAHRTLKPDLIFVDYSPCAVTNADAGAEKERDARVKAIERSIKRDCHVAEFTAHLQADLRGLSQYLHDKVLVYGDLLQSV